MSRFTPPGDCPVCGAEVPCGARACPECGASHSDGWSEDTDADGLDLPETDQERAAREGDEAGPRQGPPSQAFNVLVVVILILIFSGLWLLF